ncbi:MAG TPA: MerR family transcriptional regulator [Gemmatimonadales bacterium]|jgi:DNA-binding transcriptional MerR regulator
MPLTARAPSAPTARTYEIHEVAELTGLATARLRAWERRYEVVRPRRMPNGYRVYTVDQVALLRAYAHLIGEGERVGDLAACTREEVLARAEARRLDDSPHGALFEAILELDRDRLETLVAGQLALRGLRGFAAEVVLPLANAIGERWAKGDLSVAAEHLASEVMLHALKGGLRLRRGSGPLLLAGCIAGERHEWGFLCTLAEVQERGWRIQYLGADLPVDEIATAAWKLSPRAVALSASDPATVRANLPALAALPAKLPPGTTVAIGGAGTEAHAGRLRNYGYRMGPHALAIQI